MRDSGVQVSVIAPGSVKTEFAYGSGRTPGEERPKTVLISEYVAEAIVFASSQPARAPIFLIGIRAMLESL